VDEKMPYYQMLVVVVMRQSSSAGVSLMSGV
jgi:hypothetical protein